MSIRIIIDSTADVTEKNRDRFVILPMTISFGEEEFLDGVDITKDEFYTKLVDCEVLPKTSQGTPDMFYNIFKKVTENGDEAVAITLSSALSGTWQNACIAAEDFPGIRVVDSLNATIGSGVLAEYALQCVDKGMNIDEIAAELEEMKGKVKILAVLDTLEFLKKGGRISNPLALAGGLLNIKPVVTVTDGEVVIMGKARGMKKANNFLNLEIEKSGLDFSKPLILGYSGVSDESLRKYIEDSRPIWEGKTEKLETAQVCSVIGTHVGPGGVAVAFFKES